MEGTRPAIVFALLGVAWGLGAAAGGAPKPRDEMSALVAVEASTVGRFAKGCSWYLRVSRSGVADLSIESEQKPVHRRFTVSAQRLAELRAVVEREQFFSLSDEYGESVPDGSTTVIGVNVGGRRKVVTIRFLMNWAYSDPKRLREPARALRVLQIIRGWFDDGDAIDLRRYDALVIEAASGPTR
jgi:hypothetical protein